MNEFDYFLLIFATQIIVSFIILSEMSKRHFKIVEFCGEMFNLLLKKIEEKR